MWTTLKQRASPPILLPVAMAQRSALRKKRKKLVSTNTKKLPTLPSSLCLWIEPDSNGPTRLKHAGAFYVARTTDFLSRTHTCIWHQKPDSNRFLTPMASYKINKFTWSHTQQQRQQNNDNKTSTTTKLIIWIFMATMILLICRLNHWCYRRKKNRYAVAVLRFFALIVGRRHIRVAPRQHIKTKQMDVPTSLGMVALISSFGLCLQMMKSWYGWTTIAEN